jgi:hypothetical protein
LRHKQASQEGFWMKWQHVSNNLSKKLKKLVHKMPLTPNQIEMWGNFFQTFFQIFAIIFTEKGNMQQNISFIFIFVVCVKFSHKNIND